MRDTVDKEGLPKMKQLTINSDEDIFQHRQKNLFSDVKAEIERKGYLHFKSAVGLGLFEDMARFLGIEIVRDDVKLKKSKLGVYSPAAIPFHTDGIISDYVGWYCIQPHPVMGALLLIDCADIFECFSEEDLTALGQIESGPPIQNHTVPYLRPIISWRAQRRVLFYTPWNVRPMKEDLSHVFEKFQSYVKEKEVNRKISIHLKQGECLFIDNRRILHGRDALPPDSARHLIRVWLSTTSFEKELLSKVY